MPLAQSRLSTWRDELASGTELKLKLAFMGHYGEPSLEIVHQYDSEGNTKALHLLEYSPHTDEWKTTREDQ